jgi:diketogulonate reductase-like aldo/keto reductase
MTTLSLLAGDSVVNLPRDAPVAEYQVSSWQLLQETWQAMEKLVDEGLTRSIGISNFSVKKIEVHLFSPYITTFTTSTCY